MRHLIISQLSRFAALFILLGMAVNSHKITLIDMIVFSGAVIILMIIEKVYYEKRLRGMTDDFS